MQRLYRETVVPIAGAEDLSVRNILYIQPSQDPVGIEIGLVFVDFGLRAQFQEVGEAPDVVVVPVREEAYRYGGGLGLQGGGEVFFPGWESLAGVEEDARPAAAEEVGVRAWKL